MFIVPEYADMWIGQSNNVVPVQGFTAEEGRTTYDVITPLGRFDVIIERRSETEVWGTVYDGEDVRVFSAEVASFDDPWTKVTQECATFVSNLGWPKGE